MQDQELKLQRFFLHFAERIKQWEYAHTPYTIDPVTKEAKLGQCRIKPPVHWSPVANDYVWLNRQERRGQHADKY